MKLAEYEIIIFNIMSEIETALERARDTKALEFGVGTMAKVPAMFNKLFPGKTAVVVADKNTYAVAGEAVYGYLKNAGINTESPFIFTDPELFAEWSYIGQLEAFLKERDVIAVAVGSGVINDLTKLVSSHLGRRYMIVGTAASMDGYTAYGASITFEGNKQTFDCPAPLGMVSTLLLQPRHRKGCPHPDMATLWPRFLQEPTGSLPMQ